MHYVSELHDGADRHFRDWLARLAAGDASARTTAWGLGVDLAGLAPEAAFEAVAAAFTAQGAFEQLLYASAIFGGPSDDDDATDSAVDVIYDMIDERGTSEEYREEARRARIVKRIRRGDYSDLDVEWLEVRAAGMEDAEVLRMQPFGEEKITELARRVVTASTPQTDFWTRREIAPDERHLMLRESVGGRERESRHSLLSAYLHVVAGDGGASEFLAEYDEHVALAS